MFSTGGHFRDGAGPTESSYRARQIAALEGMGMIQREHWIQCDTCQKWRRTSAEVAEEHSTRHWECSDGARTCPEPCDYCRYTPHCRCDLIADEEAGSWCVRRGYTIPTGFTMHVKTPLEEESHVVYRAVCRTCGVHSECLDNEERVEEWLKRHGGCRGEWARLEASDFDFKVDQQLKTQINCLGEGGKGEVRVQGNGEACVQATHNNDSANGGVSPMQQGNSSPSKVQMYEGGTGREAGYVEASGGQVWGSMGSGIQHVRPPAAAPYHPAGVGARGQIRGMWSGNPYGQPYGWVPLSDHLQFRSL